MPFTFDDNEDSSNTTLTCYAGLPGPEETPYAGGVFIVCCQLTSSYPISSPSVAFTTKIWHPNVEKLEGAVCLDVLQDRWSPITRLSSVFESYLPELLRCPNTADPLNVVAAAMMKENATEYTDYARIYTRKYGMNEESTELPKIHI